MLLIGKILLDGTIFSVLASIFILASLSINPRIWLQDYPKDIQASVPPKTEKEKRLSLVFGIPFLILLAGVPLVSTFSLKNQMDGQVPFGSLFLNAAGVAFFFNLVDWLILDWLIICTLTPRWAANHPLSDPDQRSKT